MVDQQSGYLPAGECFGEESGRQVITFLIDGQTYAIDIGFSREIIAVPDITKVPHLPGFVMGVMNLRGEIISVLNIAALLGLRPSSLMAGSRIIVIRAARMTGAILVDRVDQVIHLDPEKLQDPIGGTADPADGFVTAIAPAGPVPIAILDFEKIFSSGCVAELG